MYQAIVLGCAAALVASLTVPLRKRASALKTVLKIVTVLFCTVGFFRYLLPDAIVNVINGIWKGGVYYTTYDYPGVAIRWGYYTCYAVLPMAVFFDSRFFKNMAVYFCLPFSLITTAFFGDFMRYFLDPRAPGFRIDEALRYAYFIFELVLAIAIPLILAISERHVFAFRDKHEWARFLVGVPLVLLAMVPVYLPAAFFGQNSLQPAYFGTYHLTWLIGLLAVTLGLYYAFRFRSYRDRYMLCVFLTLVLFFHYQSLYLMGVTIKRLPFQLCNIAAYFYMVAVIFKFKKMFHFCFLVNTVGTLFAILAPDFAYGNFGFWNVHYIIEHSYVLIIPALCMGLRIFPRISKRSLFYAFVGFTAYITFAYVLGTILNGYSDVTGERVNYFFMFDFDTAYDYFPFLKFIEETRWEFGRFEVYPWVFPVVYAAFSLLYVLFFFAVRLFYKMEDDHLELRLSAIELREKLTGRKSRRPREFKD